MGLVGVAIPVAVGAVMFAPAVQAQAGAELVALGSGVLGWRMWRMGVEITREAVTVHGLFRDHAAPRVLVRGIRAYRIPLVWGVLFRAWGAVEWRTQGGYVRRFGAGLWFGTYADAVEFAAQVEQALGEFPPLDVAGPSRTGDS